MFIHSIKITIISIIFIFLIHNLFSFFKTTLTVPKFKDLVDAPIKKYETMFNVMSFKSNNDNVEINLPTMSSSSSSNVYTEDYNLKNTNSMKNELKSFLKKTLNSVPEEGVTMYDTTNSTTDISFLSPMPSNNNYAIY